MLCHFFVFLGFFFSLVKFGKPKFIVLGTIFFNWLFVFYLFLMYGLKWLAQFKIDNNLPLKIYYENIMDVTLF